MLTKTNDLYALYGDKVNTGIKIRAMFLTDTWKLRQTKILLTVVHL